MKQASSSQSLRTLLRNHGMRVTPQRLAMAEMLFPEHRHVTARDVHEQLRRSMPGISLNTVYLTLGQFESNGLLRRFDVGGNTVFDSNTAPHAHACCTRCRTITDLPDHAASSSMSPRDALRGWEITGEQHIWLGLCPRCSHASQ